MVEKMQKNRPVKKMAARAARTIGDPVSNKISMRFCGKLCPFTMRMIHGRDAENNPIITPAIVNTLTQYFDGKVEGKGEVSDNKILNNQAPKTPDAAPIVARTKKIDKKGI